MKFSAAIFTALLAVVSAAPAKDTKEVQTTHKDAKINNPPPPPNGWRDTFSLYIVPVDIGRRNGWRGRYPYLQVSADVDAMVNVLKLSTDNYPDTFNLEYSSNGQPGAGFLQYTGWDGRFNMYGGFQVQNTLDSGNVGAVPFVIGNTNGVGSSRLAFSGDLSFDNYGRLIKGWNSNQFYICPTWSQNRRVQNLALNVAQNGIWDNGRSGCYNVWVYKTFNGQQTFRK